jgi:hypothetical protein
MPTAEIIWPKIRAVLLRRLELQERSVLQFVSRIIQRKLRQRKSKSFSRPTIIPVEKLMFSSGKIIAEAK